MSRKRLVTIPRYDPLPQLPDEQPPQIPGAVFLDVETSWLMTDVWHETKRKHESKSLLSVKGIKHYTSHPDFELLCGYWKEAGDDRCYPLPDKPGAFAGRDVYIHNEAFEVAVFDKERPGLLDGARVIDTMSLCYHINCPGGLGPAVEFLSGGRVRKGKLREPPELIGGFLDDQRWEAYETALREYCQHDVRITEWLAGLLLTKFIRIYGATAKAVWERKLLEIAQHLRINAAGDEYDAELVAALDERRKELWAECEATIAATGEVRRSDDDEDDDDDEGDDS